MTSTAFASQRDDRAARPASARAAERVGAIVLARHGEPALHRGVKLDADGYRRWWARYEEGGLLCVQRPPDALIEVAKRARLLVPLEQVKFGIIKGRFALPAE